MGCEDAFLADAMAQAATGYKVRGQVIVKDRRLLWQAVQEHLAQLGWCEDDVVEHIGSAADVSVDDCLRVLYAAIAVPGCAVRDVVVTSAGRAEVGDGMAGCELTGSTVA